MSTIYSKKSRLKDGDIKDKILLLEVQLSKISSELDRAKDTEKEELNKSFLALIKEINRLKAMIRYIELYPTLFRWNEMRKDDEQAVQMTLYPTLFRWTCRPSLLAQVTKTFISHIVQMDLW